MTRDDRDRWDRRYAERGPLPVEAAALPPRLQHCADVFPTAGHALDLACGAGAGSVWLAQRGLNVRGCDASPVAIQQARDLARRCGQIRRCRFDVHDLDAGLPSGRPVDVVLCHKFRDARLDYAVVDRLTAGGVLAICVLSEVGAAPGPFRAARGELAAAFAALQIVDHGERDGEAWLVARRR
ncbi:class I SAM-dependent methyltransferase [Mycobacterium sp. smrl_JER01]|uniref:class I SAM-dependent methyltransferase n=1 Tax=Mycobacterium sp. smrl_JER01 TaxID=3402633 RepID=UPI003AD38D2A